MTIRYNFIVVGGVSAAAHGSACLLEQEQQLAEQIERIALTSLANSIKVALPRDRLKPCVQ